MNNPFYKDLFPTRLAERYAVHDFATTRFGTRLATSVGGVLTGRGANWIILDDPLKPDEALSGTKRKSVNHWYDGTVLSRLDDKEKGCIIIIMQRLHQDDLVGHVLSQENWHVLSLPAIAEEDETLEIVSPLGRSYFRRTAGDPLDPEHELLATLATIRREIGEYNFTSQYQQNPTPIGGQMVKRDWLRFYDTRPVRFDRIVESWDTANKVTELSDYSACTTWGVLDKDLYLLDVFRERLNYPDLKRKVVELAHLHKPTSIVIEDKASGTQLIQDLRAEGLYSLKPYQPPSGTDKIMRLHAQTGVFENGFVFLPKEAPWLSGLHSGTYQLPRRTIRRPGGFDDASARLHQDVEGHASAYSSRSPRVGSS